MKKKIGLFAAIILISAFCVAIVEPAAAAKLKLVDKGSIKSTDSEYGYIKDSWFTYQKGTNYVKVKNFHYIRGHTYKDTYILQKVSKTKLKITAYIDGQKTPNMYIKTRLTAARYYWRSFRPDMISGNED